MKLDPEEAEARLAAITPADTAEAGLLAAIRAMVLTVRIMWFDRAGDADYERAALAHCEEYVALARELDAKVSLSGALYWYQFHLLGDPGSSIIAGSEGLRLAEEAGASMLVDTARLALAEALVRVATADPDQLRAAAAALRTAVAAAVEHSNRSVLALTLADTVERVLWTTGDHRSAALISKTAREWLPLAHMSPSVVDLGMFNSQTIAEIERDASLLDLEGVGTLALAALDRILASPS